MNLIGKIIGFFIGGFLFGPVGAMLGIFFGHLYDRSKLAPNVQQMQGEAQQAFFDTTFAVMGHIAKADGRVTEGEIQVARAIMQRMGLNEQQRRRAINEFNRGKQADFNLESHCQFMMRRCHRHRSILKMFLEIQTQAAYANGIASPRQQQILQNICRIMHMPVLNFTLLNMIYGRRTQQQQYHYQQSNSYRSFTQNPVGDLSQAYAMLEITASATDAEVKKAYRRMMSQNHPDKLVAKGLPEEMVKMATEKTQRIQKAYEQICKARGMK